MILQKFTIYKPPDRQIIFIVRIFNQFKKLTMTTHTPLISFLSPLCCVHAPPPLPVAFACCPLLLPSPSHPPSLVTLAHRLLPSPAAIACRHRPPPSATAIGRRSSPVALTAAHRPCCRPRCRPRWLSSLSPSPVAHRPSQSLSTFSLACRPRPSPSLSPSPDALCCCRRPHTCPRWSP